MRSTNALYKRLLLKTARRSDRIFAKLFVFQWLMGVVLALLYSTYTWEGTQSSFHPHIYAAVLLGGLLASLPLTLFRIQPDHPINPHFVAISQMLFSTLFIHVTGGRIETHFHVFGSLAFISFYRSRGPIWTATAITILDHLLRGYFWPESVYGVAFASPFRAVEHGAWVVFEVIVLLQIIKTSKEEMRSFAKTQTRLEASLEVSAKMSALGEFMSGVAHEINNPVTSIKSFIELYERRKKEGTLAQSDVEKTLSAVSRNSTRILNIVKSMKNFSRMSEGDPMESVGIQTIFSEVLQICHDSMLSDQIDVQVEADDSIEIECRASEIEQVLLNLVSNARHAISSLENKWIKLDAYQDQDSAMISVTDAGSGIPPEIIKKIMTPFFTTKEKGVGTGLGLSISRKIIESHSGTLSYDKQSDHTRFTIRLPLRQPATQKPKPARSPQRLSVRS